MTELVGCFKFTDQKYLDALLSGRLLARALNYFRIREIIDGIGVGDIFEGSQILQIDGEIGRDDS